MGGGLNKSNPDETKKYFIAQLHFRIGVLKDFLPEPLLMASHGVPVGFVLADRYRPFLTDEICQKSYFIRSYEGPFGMFKDVVRFFMFGWIWWVWFFLKEKPHYFQVPFVHPVSFAVFIIGKMVAPGCRFGLTVHEPLPHRDFIRGKAKAVSYIHEWLQAINIYIADDLIAFSPFGRQQLEARYRADGKIHQASHCFLPLHSAGRSERTAINIANTLYQDGRSKLFSRLVLAAQRDHPHLRFRIVVGKMDSEISDLARLKLPNIEIINPPFLSDACIENSIREAWVQVLGHRSITQSGVLPIAFKCGTPVLARNVPGFNQFVRHGYNGYLVAPEAPLREWFDGVHYILEHFDELSENCLQSFEKYFSLRNLNEQYSWLLDYFM